MDGPENTRPPSSVTDDDGVHIARRDGLGRRPALLYKTLALVLTAGCAGYLIMTGIGKTAPGADDSTSGVAAPSSPAAQVASPAATGAPASAAVTARPAGQAQDISVDLADYLAPGSPAPSVAEVIERLHDAGIHSGIGAFSPPGTSPPLVGLAVPEDFPLPEGYVRHFQATDDGQRIEPILMFSPDFEFFDANGRPIRIPDNRVVPPELAPPGLPVRLIDIPPPLVPGRP